MLPPSFSERSYPGIPEQRTARSHTNKWYYTIIAHGHCKHLFLKILPSFLSGVSSAVSQKTLGRCARTFSKIACLPLPRLLMLGMMPGKQNLRHLSSPGNPPGAYIAGYSSSAAIGKGFFAVCFHRCRARLRHMAHHAVHQHHRRTALRLSAHNHRWRSPRSISCVQNALVHALIMAAKNIQLVIFRQLHRHFLRRGTFPLETYR